MKKTKVIIPALGLLVLSTAASVTGTVAWFSANLTAQATGMQVVAKSEETFLQIGTGANSTAALIHAANPNTSVALTVTDEESQVYPSKPKAASEIGEGKLFATGTPVTDAASAAAYANWYTATNTDPSTATGGTVTASQLTTFTNYVIQKTVYLTVAAGANNANNLKVTAAFTQKTGGTDLAACKVLVTTDDGGFATLTSSNYSNVDIKGTNTAITDSTVRTVNLYIYYDGSESVVYTNNKANLKGATIDLTFGVEAVSAQA